MENQKKPQKCLKTSLFSLKKEQEWKRKHLYNPRKKQKSQNEKEKSM